MDVDSWLVALRDQGELLARAAERVELAAAVPTCPEWTVRDLLLHTGGVHRWAGTIVREARTEWPDIGDAHEIEPTIPADAELIDWFREGHARLCATIEAAPDDLKCLAFMKTARSPKAFWARRQAHETTIHRVDAESASGPITEVDPVLAVNGIDELVTGFVPRSRRLRADPERTMLVSTTDAARGWRVRVGPDRAHGVALEPDDSPGLDRADADVRLTGRANDVYLALWNRAPLDSLTVHGDTEVLTLWAELMHVRWNR